MLQIKQDKRHREIKETLIKKIEDRLKKKVDEESK